MDDTPEFQLSEQLAQLLIKAVETHNYTLLSAVGMMALVLVLRKWVLPKLGIEERWKPYLPWLTVVLAMVAAGTSVVLTPEFTWDKALAAAFNVGFMSIGAWEFGKSTGTMVKSMLPGPKNL